MSIPSIAKATLQNALVSATSNVLAQGIGAYREGKPLEINLHVLFQFTACAIIQSPLGFLWLEALESIFPSNFTDNEEEPAGKSQNEEKKSKKSPSKPRLNVRNAVLKVVIDQTIGAAWNTVLFISSIGTLRGKQYDAIMRQLQTDFWPFFMSGLKLWPFVALLNFTLVPADKRLLVGSLFGLAWGVYVSLIAG